jgi:hypothetical protein
MKARLHGLAYRFFGRLVSCNGNVNENSGSYTNMNMCEPAGPKTCIQTKKFPRIK